MSDYCTIFARALDSAGFPDRLREAVLGDVEVRESGGEWARVVVRGSDASLAFNAMRWSHGGDACSKTVLGAMTFFRRVDTTHAANRQRILEHLRACRLVVGVVGDPAFSDASGHDALIMAAARELDGLVFNGTAMFDASGRLLLDRDGRADERP